METTNTYKRGILLIALGHLNYGRMASALAATLRARSQTVPIHLAYSESAIQRLSDEELGLFTDTRLVEPWMYTTNEHADFVKAKTHLYELSPFEETLYLDADLLWLSNDPVIFMDSLAECDLTYPNFGITGSLWAKDQDLTKIYGKGSYYNVHSELLWFKKGPRIKEWFELAHEVYTNPKVNYVKFAHGVPDELAFSVASAKLELYPHVKRFRPVYWFKYEQRKMHLYEMRKEFQAFSMAGNMQNSYERMTYNILSEAAYQKLGLKNSYKWKQKRSYLVERINI